MRRGLIVGIIGWLLATIGFRYFGQLIVTGPGAGFLVALVVLGLVAAAIALLAARLFCVPGKSARFAGGVVLPGLLGDAAVTMAMPTVLPNIATQHAAQFAAMMLWGYGVILAALLLFGDKVTRSE